MISQQLDNSNPEVLGIYKKLMEECILKCIQNDFAIEPLPKHLKTINKQINTIQLEELEGDNIINSIVKSLSSKIEEKIGSKQLKKHIVALKAKNKGHNKVPAANLHGVESLVSYLTNGEKNWKQYYGETKSQIDINYFEGWEFEKEKMKRNSVAVDRKIIVDNTIKNLQFEYIPTKRLRISFLIMLFFLVVASIYADYKENNIPKRTELESGIAAFNIVIYLFAIVYQLLEVQNKIDNLKSFRNQITLLHKSYLGFLFSGFALYILYLLRPEYLSIANAVNTFYIFLMFSILDTTQIFDKNKIQKSLSKYLEFFLYLSFFICLWDIQDKYILLEIFPKELGVLLMSILNSVAAMLLFSRMASVYLKIRRFLIILLFVYASLQMEWDTVTMTASQSSTSDIILMASLLILKVIFLLIVGNNLFDVKNLQNYFEGLTTNKAVA